MAHQVIVEFSWARAINVPVISGTGITGISSHGTILALIGALRAHTDTGVEVALGAGALLGRIIVSVGEDGVALVAVTG